MAVPRGGHWHLIRRVSLLEVLDNAATDYRRDRSCRLGRLLQGGFVGTAAELAEEVHCQERYVWVSVAGLAECGLINAQRNAAGGLRMKITVAGRLAHSAKQLKYAPTAKERKQLLVARGHKHYAGVSFSCGLGVFPSFSNCIVVVDGNLAPEQKVFDGSVLIDHGTDHQARVLLRHPVVERVLVSGHRRNACFVVFHHSPFPIVTTGWARSAAEGATGL